MGIPAKAAQATFDIDEVIREASTSEKVSLLSGTTRKIMPMMIRSISSDNF